MKPQTQNEVIGRFPARLRELRESAGLSQTELARKSGVPQATIAAYEVGRHAPTWPNVIRLADAIGVGLESFRVMPGESAKQDKA